MILVTGGTGVVGSRVVRGLIAEEQKVRVLARGHSDWVENPMPQLRKLGVDVINADVRDSDKLNAAVEGCTAIIHCANIMLQSKDTTLESVNVDATRDLLKLASKAGVQRIIYMSCLGASRYCNSQYLRTKWEGETAVRDSNFYWTIFRPSLIFAKESQFIRALDFWNTRTPFLFVVGSGLNKIQAVSADDVAACVIQSLYDQDTVKNSYDLVGPTAYSLTEIVEMAGRYKSGIDRSAFKIPSSIGYAVANVMRQLNPTCPISEDVMRVLTSEYSGDSAIMKNNFEVSMLPLESYFKPIEGSKNKRSKRSATRQPPDKAAHDEHDDDDDDDDDDE